MVPVRTPEILKRLYPSCVWTIPAAEKTLYLTFDDGPIPEVTPWVLQQLNQYGAKATFFCVGNNVLRHPQVYSQILDNGHRVGNHTFSHLNGFKTDSQEYLSDVERAGQLMQTSLFRPPYGRLRAKQIKILKLQYQIVMWTVLSKDYSHISPEECFANCSNLRSGDIVLFHDSLKASRNLTFTLPRVLEKYSAEGYTFEVIP